MMTCISENKEWIFSGIGLTVLSGLIAVVRFIVKRLVHNYQLRNTPPYRFKYAYSEDDYWPWHFFIEEPDQKFLSNCSIKTHSLLLKKLKKTIKSYESLVWIDIDKFTQINKNFGRECGDVIIHTILMIIAAVVNELNLDVKVFHANKRDEFYIIGANDSIDIFTVEMFISAISQYDWSSLVPDLFVTCSAGLASYNNSSTDTLKRARVSLNLIKAKGGNGIGPEIFALHPYKLVNLDIS